MVDPKSIVFGIILVIVLGGLFLGLAPYVMGFAPLIIIIYILFKLLPRALAIILGVIVTIWWLMRL